MRNVQRNGRERGGIIGSLIVLLALALLCTLIYLARRPLLRFAGESWIVEDAIEKSDAIIVLSDDNFYADRATHAVELLRQGLAPVVVASGRRLRPTASIAELMEHDLVERGVPREKVLKFSQDGDNTKEEAEALLKLVQQKQWKRVIVVTSNYHTRRARYIFRHVFGEGCEVRMASAHDADFDPAHWYEKRKGIEEFIRELAGMTVAIWELHGGGGGPHASQGIVGLVRLKLRYAV